jgi:hypothetical protein
MTISLDVLRAGGSCYTVEEEAVGFTIHLANDDRKNFNIIARRLIDEAGPVYVVFPRSDGAGGYDCVHIIPH